MIFENGNLNSVNRFIVPQSDIEANGKMTSIIDRFESISKELNFWQSIDKNVFEDEFLVIEKLKSQGKFDSDQINRITSIVMDVFPLISDPSLEYKIIQSVCRLDQKNIYNLLFSAKKMNSLRHIQDCLMIMNSESEKGIHFFTNDPSCVSINVIPSEIESPKIQEQILAVASIFNKNISLSGCDQQLISPLNWFLHGSGLALPFTIMNNSVEWGYMTETLKTIGRLFNHYPGICIGEDHSNYAAQDFLIDNMSYFKSKGVNTLFIESFIEEMQEELDVCYETGKVSQRLLEYINSSSYPGRLLEVFQEAAKYGIRIISMDREAFLVGDTVEQLIYRSKKMNPFAAEKIKSYMASGGNGKFIALMGLSHLVEFFPGVPGVCDLIKCPPLKIVDLNEDHLDSEGLNVKISYLSPVIPIVYSSAFRNFGVGVGK